MKKIYYSLFIMLITVITVKAQKEPHRANILQPQDANWNLLEERTNIKIYEAYSSCSDEPCILLKIVNGTNNRIKVSWESEFIVSGTVLDVAKKFEIELEPNSSKCGTCGSEELVIYPFLYVSTIKEGESNYTIKNLKINLK